MTKTVLLINGPPGSGKDTLANAMAEKYTMEPLKFAAPLRRAVPALFGITTEEYELIIESQTLKNSPRSALLGLSAREAQIWVSETCMKPKFGAGVFGEIAANTILSHPTPDQTFVISDSGFETEARVLIDYLGPENVCMIQLTRDGCSFERDSRSYVNIAEIPTYVIPNDDSIPNLINHAASIWWAWGVDRLRSYV